MLDFTSDSTRGPADNYGTPSQPQGPGGNADHWTENAQLSQGAVATRLVAGLAGLFAVPQNIPAQRL